MLLEFNGWAWLIGMAILIVPLTLLRRRGGFYLFFFSVFWVYLLVLVSVTVFPMPLGMDGGFRFKSIWQQIGYMVRVNVLNLVPLYFNQQFPFWILAMAAAVWDILLINR